jgi:hypothetical protein
MSEEEKNEEKQDETEQLEDGAAVRSRPIVPETPYPKAITSRYVLDKQEAEKTSAEAKDSASDDNDNVKRPQKSSPSRKN